MECSILYEFSLCAALSLMFFFGIYFISAKVPDKTIYETYLRSRRIMGAALLLLAANYCVHFFYGIRFKNVNAAILMNLSTYFLSYWLFSSALMALLDRFYLTKRRFIRHIIIWIMFTIFSGTVLMILPDNIIQKIAMLIMAAWLFIYGTRLAYNLLKAYHKAVRLFDDTHSEHIAAYIRWLSIFTYWAVIYGVSCGLLTFLPDRYIYLWVLSSIPFYIYLYCSYMNYLLFYEQVENILETEAYSKHSDLADVNNEDMPICFMYISERLSSWIDNEGYIKKGLTLNELAEELNTNRTYLSAYIKETYKISFREWITRMRIDYAKKKMIEHPELTIIGISEMSGYMSQSNFMKLFRDKEGCTPAQWRKNNMKRICCK